MKYFLIWRLEAWMPFVANLIPPFGQAVGMYTYFCTVHCNIWASNAWNKYRIARVAIYAINREQLQNSQIDQRDLELILKSQRILQAETDNHLVTVGELFLFWPSSRILQILNILSTSLEFSG